MLGMLFENNDDGYAPRTQTAISINLRTGLWHRVWEQSKDEIVVERDEKLVCDRRIFDEVR